MTLELRVLPYDHPDAVALTAEVQVEYQRRYGSDVGDASPIDPAEFVWPTGQFVVGYVDDVPVATGGWRTGGAHEGDGEIKRMYVRESHRGRGFSRQVLEALEQSARERGIARLVLETGQQQPEAISLYKSCGYDEIEKFGYYAGYDDSVHLGKLL